MCGIVGIFAYKDSAPPADRNELRRIRDRMAARGPDGKGEWFSSNGRVALGHRRLSIIDLSDRASQPMTSADGKLVVTFNGEIYNYRELRAKLEAQGRVFRSDSDTEVLLHLYATKGEAMVEDLRGMFAFALWDDTRKSMLLARDPFGIKPLYIAHDGRTLRFASQVQALLQSTAIDTAEEPAGHVGFFLWGHVPEPFTLYRGIRALPAGSLLRAHSDGVHERQYFDLPQFFASGSGRSSVDTEQMHEALRDSVRAHLVADVPVGVFLSAGIDSTTLAALASEAHPDILTVTLGFRMGYTEATARMLPGGSCVVELARKTLATEHLKRSGMRWRHPGDQAIPTFRCLVQSNRFHSGWKPLSKTYHTEVGIPHNVLPSPKAGAR